MVKYLIYWTDKLNEELGEEQEEFKINAKNQKEARKKGRIKAYKTQLSEYKYRIKNKLPHIKKPQLSKIIIEDVVKE